MDTTGRIFGAAATKHFESASTSERNQRAAEQRVRVAASPLICLWGHGGGESGTMGDPSEFHLRRCSRRRASWSRCSRCWVFRAAELGAAATAAAFFRTQLSGARARVAWRVAWRVPSP